VGAVFINRTVRGIEKRSRLEEAQSRDSSLEQNSPATSHLFHDTAAAAKVNEVAVTIASQRMPRQINNNTVTMERFHSVFLESYLPIQHQDGLKGLGSWLTKVMHLSQPEKGLDYSLRALSMTRAGRICKDPNLVAQGRIAYGCALQRVQNDMMRQELLQKDQMLAACWLLAVYEVRSP
jgi:hypothetical protein